MRVNGLSMLMLSLLLVVSCEVLPGARGTSSGPAPRPVYPPGSARLLVYIHSTAFSPPDVAFTLEGMEFESFGGKKVVVEFTPIEISAVNLVNNQMFLVEAFVEPGAYNGVNLNITKASMRSGEGRASLTLPEHGGTSLPFNAALGAGESSVVSLAWNPNESVEKRHMFLPDIKAEPQAPSPKNLLLFVSNRGSNYISIIDKSLERVIAAVTVGNMPSGMAINQVKEALYVLNSKGGTVSEVDAVNFRVRDTIRLPLGIEPTDIAYVPAYAGAMDGKLYVVNHLSNDVLVMDTLTTRLVKTITVGTMPSFMAVDALRRELYVTNEMSNNVSVINADANAVVATIKTDARPSGLATGDGKIYVFSAALNSITVISQSTREVLDRVSVGQSPERGLKAFNGRLMTANAKSGSVSFFNREHAFQRSVPAGKSPVAIAADEKRNRIYVADYDGNEVILFDPVGERYIKTLTVGPNPYGVTQPDSTQ